MAKTHDAKYYRKQAQKVWDQIAQLKGTNEPVFKRLQKKGAKYMRKATLLDNSSISNSQ